MKEKIKEFLKKLPLVYPVVKFIKLKIKSLYILYKHKGRGAEKIFQSIYLKNFWGDSDSLSGPGSNLEVTKVLRNELSELFTHLKISSILDIPCGDFHWMKDIKFDNIKYIGADIIQDLVESNKKYESGNIAFKKLDIIKDELPTVDLILVRDCFIHFSYKDIFASLKNICMSNSEYLLVTTFNEQSKNEDIPTGDWRPINFTIPPFNLPEPEKLIIEQHPEEDWKDKSLGLWRISELKKALHRHLKN